MSFILTIIVKKLVSKANGSNTGKNDLLAIASNMVEKELIPRAVRVFNAYDNTKEIDRLNTEISLIQDGLRPEVLRLTELGRELPGITGKSTIESLAAEKEYFPLLRKTQVSRKKMIALQNRRMEIKQPHVEPLMAKYAVALEAKRAIKEACVTSSTYQRARKKLTNSVDGLLSGKFRS